MFYDVTVFRFPQFSAPHDHRKAPLVTTRHLVDPALLPGIARPPTRIATAEMLPPFRAGLNKLLTLSPKLPGAITRRQIEIPSLGDDPPIRALIYQPSVECQPVGAILHIHGGGFIIGAPEMNDARNAAWCDRLNVVVLSVDYRLAPEAAYPAALHDCHAGLAWLTDHAPELRISSRPVGIAGESAGGGLSAALALFARDRGQHSLAFQLLTYPMLDDRTATIRPPGALTGEFVWTAEDNRFGWRCLLGREPGGTPLRSAGTQRRSFRAPAGLHRRGRAGSVPGREHRLRPAPSACGRSNRTPCLPGCVSRIRHGAEHSTGETTGRGLSWRAAALVQEGISPRHHTLESDPGFIQIHPRHRHKTFMIKCLIIALVQCRQTNFRVARNSPDQRRQS